MSGSRDDWAKANVEIIARHDRKLHELEISIITIASELKVIRTIFIAVMGAASLAGTIVAIVKAFA